MTDFFEPPPPPTEPDPFETTPAPWHGPPDTVIGASVGLELLLVRTDDIVLSLEGFTVYPSGFGFDLVTRLRTEELGWEIEHSMWGPWRRSRGRGTSGIPPERLRFGIQFADGSKATNIRFWLGEREEKPTGPVLVERGGQSGGRHWVQSHWVWPLPPPGVLGFACEWPAHGIPFTRVDIDAGRILEAVPRAHVLWPEEETGSEGGSAWTSLGPV
jgi:hypothetical protein